MEFTRLSRNAIVAGFSWCLILLAQESRAQLTQLNVDENLFFSSDDLTLPIFAPESENDNDLGVQMVMRPDEKYDPFNLNGSVGWYFTDNVDLLDVDTEKDNFYQSSVALSYLPILDGNLYGEATVRESNYRYHRNSRVDFDTIDAGTGLVYVVRSLGDLSVFTRYNYSSFFNPHDSWAQTYSSHSIQAGFYKPWILRRNHFLYASYISDFSFAGNPGFAQRDDHSLTLGYRFTPVEKWKTEMFYRAAFLRFHERNRKDWNHTAGLSVSYNMNRNFSISSSLSYTFNESNLDSGDYEIWMPGIQLGGIFQF